MKSFPSIEDIRRQAGHRIPHFLFEYLEGGACSEQTLRNNRLDLEKIMLRQKVLVDVSDIDTSVGLLGKNYKLPIVLGPVGLAGLYARRGECQAAVAAARKGIPFCLSSLSVCSIAEVAEVSADPFWFQLYMMRDRGFMQELLAQAAESGCSTLVFTVDLPVTGARYRDVRSGFAGADGWTGQVRRVAQALARPLWAYDVGSMGRPLELGNVMPLLHARSQSRDVFAWMRKNLDPSVTWRDLEFIRDNWDRKLILKGILDEDDAQSAASVGADAIVVSNHGGRQLDGALSTVKALPRIASTVGDKTEVLVDGGIRSGTDVLRMLALGASAVLLGRSWVYGLACNGQRGVERVIALIEAEMRVAMALCGVRTCAEINADIVARE